MLRNDIKALLQMSYDVAVEYLLQKDTYEVNTWDRERILVICGDTSSTDIDPDILLFYGDCETPIILVERYRKDKLTPKQYAKISSKLFRHPKAFRYFNNFRIASSFADGYVDAIHYKGSLWKWLRNVDY